MTTDAVTRPEMADALRKESERTEEARVYVARGLLKTLGLEPKAEMGQARWLSDSTAKAPWRIWTIYWLGWSPYYS